MTFNELVKERLLAGGIDGDFTIDYQYTNRLLLITFKEKKDAFVFEMKFGSKALLDWYYTWLDEQTFRERLKGLSLEELSNELPLTLMHTQLKS